MQVNTMFPSSSNTCSTTTIDSLTKNKTKLSFHHTDYTNKHYGLYKNSSPSKITTKSLLNPSKYNTTRITLSHPLPILEPLIEPLTQPRLRPSSPSLAPPNYQPTLNPLQKIVSLALDKIEKSLILDKEKSHPLPKTVDPDIQLSGNYAPVQESPVQTGLEVIGEIPSGLHGVYVRNGANPMLPPSGAHHLFDGDGMIHAVNLGPGNQATYCCRFTRTNRLVNENVAGRNLFPKPVGELHGRTGLVRLGLFYARAAIGLVDPARGIGVANAGIVYFNGRLLAMSEDDLPYHVKINGCDHHENDGVDLETIERFDFDGQVNCPLIAHPKVDPNTGDLHTLSYNVLRKPYLKYFRFDKWGCKLCEVPVSLPQPTMIHDFALTQNFIVIPDNQIVFKLSEMVQDGSPLRFDPNKKARFGVLSKDDTTGSKIQWVEVPNSFCFHFMNAWEENEGKHIVIIGSCMSPPDSIFNSNDNDDPMQIDLCEIRLDLETGKSTRRVIVSGMNLEIGQVNKNMLGQKIRYVYMAIAEPWPKCGGIAKVDVVTGNVTKFMYGRERYGGEPCFVPIKKTRTTPANYRDDNDNDNDNNDDLVEDDYNDHDRLEDEGWIMSFVRDENVETSELIILRAKDMKQIACVCMPSRVPYGFHGTFIDQAELSVQRS